MNARVGMHTTCVYQSGCTAQLQEMWRRPQVGSGSMASTSGRSGVLGLTALYQSAQPGTRKFHSTVLHDSLCSHSPLRRLMLARHGTTLAPARPPVCQAQKTKQESERPVMERVESDLIAGSDSNGNGVKRNGSKAPTKNSATNVADRTDTPPAQTSQDEDGNVDSGAQSHEERSNGASLTAASKVPGGITEADSMSAPKPASFWLPHQEPEDLRKV